jgi:hypothetical protein
MSGYLWSTHVPSKSTAIIIPLPSSLYAVWQSHNNFINRRFPPTKIPASCRLISVRQLGALLAAGDGAEGFWLRRMILARVQFAVSGFVIGGLVDDWFVLFCHGVMRHRM